MHLTWRRSLEALRLEKQKKQKKQVTFGDLFYGPGFFDILLRP